MKRIYLSIILSSSTGFLFAQDLNVSGNIQLNQSRSTISPKGITLRVIRGGMQFLTLTMAILLLFSPTNLSGTPVNSTITLGGFGNFFFQYCNPGSFGQRWYWYKYTNRKALIFTIQETQPRSPSEIQTPQVWLYIIAIWEQVLMR